MKKKLIKKKCTYLEMSQVIRQKELLICTKSESVNELPNDKI